VKRRILHPVRWTPPPAPPAREASDPPLPPVRRIELPGAGPEDVVLDAAGRIITGVNDGSILRVDPTTGESVVIGNSGGHPLGLEVCPDGTILICDSVRGLLHLDPASRNVQVLVDKIDGVPLIGTSNAVRAKDGTIYFSSSTRRFEVEDHVGDILEHTTTGRLFRRHPDGQVETLLDGLAFANGVVLAPDESFVLVAQTGAYCVTRYWLQGPRAGQSEPLIENLAGLPDNMSVGSDGLVWLAFATPRNRLLDALLPRPVVLRQLSWLLPHALQPKPERTVWVMGLTFEGEIVHDLQRPGDDYFFVTSVWEQEGTLYLGSFYEPAIAVTSVPH
jgi:sugar lactone lactonase YvrE